MRQLRRLWLWVVAVSFMLFARRSAAAELEAPVGGVKVEVHGFVSPGFLVTTGNNYLAKSKSGSFEFAEVGVNFTSQLSDKLRTGVQLFSRDLGPIGNYSAKLDWFYLDYRFADWLGLRAGRTKLPFGLYNESNDIDSGRVPILLPQSIYPIESRDYLLAQTGVELYGRVPLDMAGALEYRLYGGTIYLQTASDPSRGIQVLDVSAPYVVGGRLLWETPLEGLRVGGSVQALELDARLLQNSTPISLKVPAQLYIGSVEYAADDLLIAAEYSRWHVTSRVDPPVVPDADTVSERAYGMVSYRVTSFLQPGAYYSVLFPNVDDRKGRDAWQHDVAATLRFDLSDHWLWKIEGHYMKGTAGLAGSAALNDNVPLARLERDWGLFLTKTTVFF